MTGHRSSSHWFDQITRVEIERFASRDEARAAELAAITNEKPLFNVWTDTKKGVKCRSDELQKEIELMLGKIEAAGYRVRRNSCLSVMRGVLRDIEAGHPPDRSYLIAGSRRD